MLRAVVHDGLSARSQTATVEVGIDGLTVTVEGGNPEYLPFPGLARGPGGNAERTVICRDDAPDWRLVMSGASDAPWLTSLRSPGGIKRRTAIAYGAGIAAVAMVAGLAWRSGNVLLDMVAPLVPHSVTEPVGAAMVKAFAAESSVCETPEGQAALDHLLARLRPAGGYVEPIRISVVDSDTVNAFALPGGHIVILNGLIDQARDGDELAGILAHEITHVQLGHPTKALIRVVGVAGLIQALTGGTPGQLAADALVLSQSRDAERAADAGALTLLKQAGISPAGMAGFFKRMAAKTHPAGDTRAERVLNSLGTFLATHPGNTERLSAIEEASQSAGETTPAMSDDDWDALNRICDKDD